MESATESSVSSPEDVSCYEECVVAVDEDEASEEVFNSPIDDKMSSSIPKAHKDSGRVTKKSKKNRGRSRSAKDRKCSSPLILKWLEQNYEMIPAACLPRSVLYTHYQDFCKRNLVEPSSAASFGKIIRMKFPNLSTRRLGTRGQSKYHYYGLAIKETSIYFRSVYSKQGLTRFSGASLKRESGQFYNPSSKTGVLLPEFPKISDLNFGKPFPIEKVDTFLLMYRSHCQRILDSVVRSNFHEVQEFLVHFWQGMPQHMLPILGSQAIVDLVVICDFVLYNCLCEVLIPANLQQLPDNLVEEVITFSHSLVDWLFAALQDLPAPLGIRKVQGAEMFGKSLRRQIALMQLAKGGRSVLRGSEAVSCILNDWRSIDFESAAGQVVFSNQFSEQTIELFKEFSAELEQLLVKQSSLEVYFEWLDSLIERKVCEPVKSGLCSLQELSQDFIATWSNFYHVVEKEISLLKGKSIDFYQLVHIVLSEYIQHVMESLQAKVIESQYTNILTNGKGSGKAQQKGTPSNLEMVASSLPPIFPPTPTSASSEKDFLHYFESKMAHEFSMDAGFFSSSYAALQSPTYGGMGMGESMHYESFFSCELGDPLYGQQQACAPPTTLNMGRGTPHSFEGTPTPLTPQSSLCSSGSPLSHASIHSPRESISTTPDIADGNPPGCPISQIGMYNIESPLSHVPPSAATAGPAITPPMSGGFVGNCPSICSPASSACTSPLQHVPATISGSGPELSIAASLDLVAGHEPNAVCHGSGSGSPYSMEGQYMPPSMPVLLPLSSPPMSHHHYSNHHHQAMPPSYAQLHSPHLVPCPGYPMTPTMNGCSQYNFELHHLNPSDLLVEPICKVEDRKPTVRSLTQSATAII